MAAKNKPMTGKITKDDLNHLITGLIINGVKITGCVLGQGSYGTVYKADHNGTACGAKQVDLKPRRHIAERIKQIFLLECLQHSKLHHPNIVKMLGVFYPKKRAVLPFLVMELMEYNLTQLLDKHQNISMYVKLSILQDVSRGLCYLHTQNPPIVHQALYSDNILFTKGLIAKIGDFKTGAETVSEQALLRVRQNTQSNGFLPDSYLLDFDLPLNVFSFGCIICHVITQKWPVTHHHDQSIKFDNTMRGLVHSLPLEGLGKKPPVHADDTVTSYTMDDWCVEKHHQDYIDLINDNSLKQLAEACLQCKSENRPHMLLVYDRITSIMTGMVHNC